MKSLAYIAIALIGPLLQPSARANPCIEIYSAVERDFLNHQYSRSIDAEKVLGLAERVAQLKGIRVKRVELLNRESKPYPALQVLPDGASEAGIESARVQAQMFGLPLVFSPLDLSRGMSAFFDPDGSKLGVPYKFFVQSPARIGHYQHELIHATDYLLLMLGQTPEWSGLMKVREGTYLSDDNREVYFRFSALNEMVTTTLSLLYNATDLLQLKKTMSDKDFYSSVNPPEYVLREAYSDSQSLIHQSKQLIDLIEKAQAELHQYESRETVIRLGNREQRIFQTVFLLDSYDWAIKNGRGFMNPIQDGGDFILNWHQKPAQAQVAQRLERLLSKATSAKSKLQEISKSIKAGIELPQLKGTDFESLLKHTEDLVTLLGKENFGSR